VLRDHAAEVRRISADHGATDVRAFGSVARGDDRYDSDVDLLVKLRPGTGLFELSAMRHEIATLLRIPVDIVSEGGLKERDAAIRREAVAI
jgi:predicted nucleotidyltransferase